MRLEPLGSGRVGFFKQCLNGLWVCFHGCLEGIGLLKLREGLIVSMKRSSDGFFFVCMLEQCLFAKWVSRTRETACMHMILLRLVSAR